MKGKTKVWLIAAAFLVVLGLVVMAAVMTACGWDLSQLSTQRYETKTHEISQAFTHISVQGDTADIRFAVSEDGTCRVVCDETEHVRYSAAVQEDTLTVKATDERTWLDHIGISVEAPAITVYLPEGAYGALEISGSTGDIELPENFQFVGIKIRASIGDVKSYASAAEIIQIRTSTGDIQLTDIAADAIDLSVSTGKINLTDSTCRNLIAEGTTGDISLTNVIASETISILRTTGCVTFDGCDAAEVTVETDTGDVTGTFRSEMIFLTQTDTGDIEVPQGTTGGICKITTSTGDIRLSVPKTP